MSALRHALATIAVATLGCGGSLPPSAVPRPIGEDLVALLPSGAELVLDLDVEQLRAWDEIDRVLGLLPPSARARLERLGPRWIAEIDAIAVGWRGAAGTESVIVLRGDLDDGKIPALLEGAATRGEVHGHALYEADGASALRLGPRLVALGSAVEVRRVAEIADREAMGLRDSPADRPLREALAQAPSAKRGRPAVLGAAIGGPLLNERLDAAGFGARRPAWVALAVAVGDGVDAVMVLGMQTPLEAVAVRTDVDHWLRDMRARPIVRALGLQDAFDFATLARDRQVRVAYRLAGSRLDSFLERMDRGRRVVEQLPPPRREEAPSAERAPKRVIVTPDPAHKLTPQLKLAPTPQPEPVSPVATPPAR